MRGSAWRPAMLEIQANDVGKAVVLHIAGRMDAETSVEFETTCEGWINRGAKHLVVDLAGLQYVSSMGLSKFLSVAKALQPKSGSLSLCHLQAVPRQVFEMTRLIQLFPVFDNVEAALASL
jgi:anti-anti-sigma factor